MAIQIILPGFVLILTVLAVQMSSHNTVAEHSDPFSLFSDPVYGFLRDVVQQLKTNSTSTQCQNDINTVLREADAGKKWALKMFDAMGKPSSGVLEGGLSYIGYFSECLDNQMKDHFGGRYCLANIKFGTDDGFNETLLSLYPKLEIGICVPSSCEQENVASAVTVAARFLHWSAEINLRECFARDHRESLDWAAWVVIFLFSTFLLLAVVGTFLGISSPTSSNEKLSSDQNLNLGIPSIDRYGIPSIDSQTAPTSNCSSETLCKDGTKKRDIVNLRSILHAFSLANNGRKILSTKCAEGTLGAFHGIRFLSMAWIMIGHSFAFANRWLFFRNPKMMSSAPKDFLSQAFANGTFAVDTFFFLGGFLVAYTVLRRMKRTNGEFNVLSFYIHRYIRMTPVMMMVIAFSTTLLKYMGSGPSWREATLMYDEWCRKNWWTNALYIQNFVHTDNMCLSHTWYSAVDMQFYLIAPIIIKLCFT